MNPKTSRISRCLFGLATAALDFTPSKAAETIFFLHSTAALGTNFLIAAVAQVSSLEIVTMASFIENGT